MTHQEKIITMIRESLVEKHGEEFLVLTEKEQTLIICDEIEKYFERLRNGA